ncbi:hypothetical protein G6011_08718 [Alternaria panax]|uniref:RlpA-like protein double-psi beta-barrel domain-containing protein n=1 Tax=Alternaria panax TaxID=48097 RepID=A0AAD4FIL3_9PLEO|nr:hypothetical protein G6011_08718 [Alternaria panax]
MKTSAVLASILFGSYAVAAPFDRRALIYKTEVVTETVVVYTTVWDDEPVAQATTSAGEFYEKPSKPSTTSTVVVAPTSSVVASPSPASSKVVSTTSKAAPAYTPVVPEEPSSAYTPAATPTSVFTPAPTTPAPAPESSYVAPAPEPEPTTSAAPEPVYSQAPAPSSAAPAPSSAAAASYPTTGGTSAGVSFQDVEITIYDNTGAAGACGEPLTDDMKVVAIGQGAWNAMGGTTHDVMTGASTNPWCGKQIQIEYQGKTANAKIMDLCPGCTHPNDIDLSHAVWKDLGLTEITRYNGVNWKIV